MPRTDFRLSLIMPVRNGAAHLEQAFNCLLNCFSSVDQLVVIDDGSTDLTPTIIRDFANRFDNFEIISFKDSRGPAAARNAGLAVSQGSFVSFLDHDDLWPDGRLARHLACLQNNPGVSVVVGKTNYEFEGAMSERAFQFRNGSSALHHVHLGAATFRKEVFESVGVFNESLRFSEDHELFLRLREQGHNIYFDPEISLRYRVHGNNMSIDKSLKELGVFKILADSIKRRRIQGNITQLPNFGDSFASDI